MSEEKVSQYNKREKTAYMIEELLEERAQVWALYCSVAGMEPYKSNKPINERVQEFCQMLVDYISLGHFGVFQRIIDGSERRKVIIEAAERVYPKISQATEVVLSFNDKYQTLSSEIVVSQLTEDLSDLGDKLAARIDLEDELISTMLA